MNQVENNTKTAMYHKKLLNERKDRLEKEFNMSEHSFNEKRVAMRVEAKYMKEIQAEIQLIDQAILNINTDPDIE